MEMMMAAERRRVEKELIQPAHAAGLPPPVAQAASRSGKRAATRKGIFRAVAIADGAAGSMDNRPSEYIQSAGRCI